MLDVATLNCFVLIMFWVCYFLCTTDELLLNNKDLVLSSPKENCICGWGNRSLEFGGYWKEKIAVDTSEWRASFSIVLVTLNLYVLSQLSWQIQLHQEVLYQGEAKKSRSRDKNPRRGRLKWWGRENIIYRMQPKWEVESTMDGEQKGGWKGTLDQRNES